MRLIDADAFKHTVLVNMPLFLDNPETIVEVIDHFPTLEVEANENPRVLKSTHQDYKTNYKVTYDIDYLLDNLAREIYLLESFRRWKRERERR